MSDSIIWHDSPQGSEEWRIDRSGKITSSGLNKLYLKPETKTHNDYLDKLAIEQNYQSYIEDDDFETYWTRRGNEFEPFARNFYEQNTFCQVKKVGFAEKNKFVGSSLDGVVDDEGIVEIKCLKYSNVLALIRLAKKLGGIENVPIDVSHLRQVQHQLLTVKALWCDYIVYHPAMENGSVPPFIKRIYPNSLIHSEIKAKEACAISEIQKRMKEFHN